jgi:hypothetical protein
MNEKFYQNIRDILLIFSHSFSTLDYGLILKDEVRGSRKNEIISFLVPFIKQIKIHQYHENVEIYSLERTSATIR